MEIGENNFYTWKGDEVTKAVFKELRKARQHINLQLINADIVLGENADKAIPRLIGQREGLDLILEITIDDLDGEEVDES